VGRVILPVGNGPRRGHGSGVTPLPLTHPYY
jgi:hypothetical protein